MITYILSGSASVIRHAAIGRNFPGGEVNVSIQPHPSPKDVEYVFVEASMRSSDELMQFVMFIDAAKRYFYNAKIHASIPYLPYARQDRVCNEGEALSVAALAGILNSLAVAQYHLHDPHSDVSAALLGKVSVSTQAEIFKCMQSQIHHKYDAIISPDAGAQKKAYKLAEAFGIDRVITANKIRDVKTGSITEVTLTEPVDGLSVAVFDDICDGGATFVELAHHLGAARRKDLYVTHGIFSKGILPVSKHYDQVFSTNSYNPELASTGNFIVLKEFYN